MTKAQENKITKKADELHTKLNELQAKARTLKNAWELCLIEIDNLLQDLTTINEN